MDIRKIKKLIKLLEQSGISELEVKEGEESIRISRHGTIIHADRALPSQPSPPSSEKQESQTEPPPRPPDHTQHTIKAPMVGTFYRSPSPNLPPFVNVGQKIGKGDILCIIEAMKMFNRIEADQEGLLQNILVESGQAVEFDQPLFIIQLA
ncbi:MAG: acetyl-CoA carboxylase biotin carboxyl carrier protein [Gammaproteobacteria bacterium]|nr:acetyl-CoA carboxylase biotin carboxyl carrier protein [Gammaproteobacteria bacterium]